MPHQLSPFTFITGGKGSGKTTLAQLLCSHNHRIAHASFDEIIRETTLSIFFPEQMHMGIDLRDAEALKQNLPYTSTPIGDFMTDLRKMLRAYNPHLIGDLSKRRIGPLLNSSFEVILFDHADEPADLKPFVLSYGIQNCRLIIVERPGSGCVNPTTAILHKFGNTFIPQLIVQNREGKPEEMLATLNMPLKAEAAPPTMTGSWGMEDHDTKAS